MDILVIYITKKPSYVIFIHQNHIYSFQFLENYSIGI